MRVLIADDDFVSRNLVHAILLPYGRCDLAENGREVLAAVQAAWTEHKPYDVIILDIGMPEMDGQETLKQIRALEQRRRVPEAEMTKVMMVTGARDLQNVKTAMKSGCEAYLVKPIVRERLLDEIGRLKPFGRGDVEGARPEGRERPRPPSEEHGPPGNGLEAEEEEAEDLSSYSSLKPRETDGPARPAAHRKEDGRQILESGYPEDDPGHRVGDKGE